MVKTLILFESRYGFTEKISKDLALILGPAKYCRCSEFKGHLDNYEMVVLCSAVYEECIDEAIIGFVSNNREKLKEKKIVLLCSCLAENMVNQYLKPLKDLLGDSVALEASVGGILDMEKLSYEDHKSMEQFCRFVGCTLESSSTFDMGTFGSLALEIKSIKDEVQKVMPKEELIKHAEDFINKHNTCTLATGHGGAVRATPIEYSYFQGCLYIISEGGEKFSNIIVNSKVSIGIFDEYKGMDKLSGMQLSGTAELIEIGSGEYIKVLELKNISYDKIKCLPIALNLLKINISKIEFLCSAFSGLGYDIKQICTII